MGRPERLARVTYGKNLLHPDGAHGRENPEEGVTINILKKNDTLEPKFFFGVLCQKHKITTLWVSPLSSFSKPTGPTSKRKNTLVLLHKRGARCTRRPTAPHFSVHALSPAVQIVVQPGNKVLDEEERDGEEGVSQGCPPLPCGQPPFVLQAIKAVTCEILSSLSIRKCTCWVKAQVTFMTPTLLQPVMTQFPQHKMCPLMGRAAGTWCSH